MTTGSDSTGGSTSGRADASRPGEQALTSRSATFRPNARRIADPTATRARLLDACRWLALAASTPDNLARDSWRIGTGWSAPSTIATAHVITALCRVARTRAGSIDEGRLTAAGRALLERQRRDGAFEPASVDEDEEPATSAAVAAFCHWHAWNGDARAHDAARRGAARILAARARPTAAIALSMTWAITGDERFYEAACDGRAAAITRFESRRGAPLCSVREAVVDVDVLWTVAEQLADDFELEPIALEFLRKLIVRIETSGGALADGYDLDGAVARPPVDLETLCRAAGVLCALDARRHDPRGRFAAGLALECASDALATSRWPAGRVGALGARAGTWSRRETAVTASYASALAALASSRHASLRVVPQPERVNLDARSPVDPREARS